MKTIKSKHMMLWVFFFYMTNYGVTAATWYVSPFGSGSPGTDWDSAFNQIQGAVDAAGAGDLVRVGNGIYNIGGAEINSMSNRVALTQSITVVSENGPEYTRIVGAGPLGPSAVRCIYISNGGSLVGFTLTNGHSRLTNEVFYPLSGGGAWLDGGTLSNCVLTGNAAVYGGGANCYSNGMISDCMFSGNTAAADGGAVYVDYGGVFNDCTFDKNSATAEGGAVFLDSGGTLNHCTLSSNSATFGGGVNCYSNGVLNNCILSGNWADDEGGGVYFDFGGTLSDCILSGNTAVTNGGGVFCRYGGMLKDCTISSNVAAYAGGVNCYRGGTLNNCILSENSATFKGGGVYYVDAGTLNHCTITDNSAPTNGGGVYGESGGLFNNCIVWGNTPNNWFGSTDGWTNCCTQPIAGVGCITASPQFLDPGDFHLQTNSSCIDAGITVSGLMTDKEGTPRPLDGNADGFAAPDIGAYEYISAVADTDGDTVSDLSEYVADTDSTDADDWFHISSFADAALYFSSSKTRQYSLLYCTNLVEGSWADVPGQTHVMGTGGPTFLSGNIDYAACFFRVEVEIP